VLPFRHADPPRASPTHGGASLRRWRPLGALALPALLAIGSLAPVLLVEPDLDVVAYADRGEAGSPTDYWNVAAVDNDADVEMLDGQLSIVPRRGIRMIGAAFAGDHWTFDMPYVHFPDGQGGDWIFGFVADANDDQYAGALNGLRLMARRDALGRTIEEDFLAIGTKPPYKQVPFRLGTHRIVIESSWTTASLEVDGVTVWSGIPGWASAPGLYPVIDMSPGRHRIAATPAISLSFAPRAAAGTDEYRQAFVEAALAGVTPEGDFSDDPVVDGSTALGLVLAHRSSPDDRVAAALDRWADGLAAAAPPSGSWPGAAGAASIERNVGARAIPLAMWSGDRGRADWGEVIARMVEAAGFTACDRDGQEWCRLGNLQPDGTVLATNGSSALARLSAYQSAETAAFIAGVRPEDRRAWIRSLPQRTYDDMPCQSLAELGPRRDGGPTPPWSVTARIESPRTLFLLGLAYAARPDDPVWSEPSVTAWVRCRVEFLTGQVGGPIGWREEPLRTSIAIGGYDVAASRLFSTLTGVELRRDRFDVAWQRAIDADGHVLLEAGTSPAGPSLEASLAAVLAQIVGRPGG
jgi:hypothetical protein